MIRDYICCLDGFISVKVMSIEQARQYLLQKSNSLYDPEVVEHFLQMLTESKSQYESEYNDEL